MNNVTRFVLFCLVLLLFCLALFRFPLVQIRVLEPQKNKNKNKKKFCQSKWTSSESRSWLGFSLANLWSTDLAATTVANKPTLFTFKLVSLSSSETFDKRVQFNSHLALVLLQKLWPSLHSAIRDLNQVWAQMWKSFRFSPNQTSHCSFSVREEKEREKAAICKWRSKRAKVDLSSSSQVKGRKGRKVKPIEPPFLD